MFTIKKGDRLPSYSATLTDVNGVAQDLTGNTGVTFRFKSGTTTISGAGVVVLATAGTVRYDWGSSDTLVVGQYDGEIVVHYAGGDQTYPSSGYVKIEITRSLV